MKKFIVISLLLLTSFQFSIATRKHYIYDPNELDELLDILREDSDDENHSIHLRKTTHSNVDPNDHVDVELWNKLNQKDMENMPQIDDYSNENTAARWLNWYSRISLRYSQISSHLSWLYDTNITTENQNALSAQSLIRTPFSRLTLPIAKKFHKHLKDSTDDEDLKRIFKSLASGTTSDNNEDVKKISALHSNMTQIYSTANVCEPNNQTKCYTLSPYLERTMQTEKDYERLIWAWKGWHDACGNAVRPVYLSYIDLLNNNAKENGYKDLSDVWIEDYEMGNRAQFENTMDQILQTIMPLYKQLHAYVRGRLCAIYPNRFDCNGPIPAHLLGNMWTQAWQERFDDLIPYPDTPLVNITQVLDEKKYSIENMYTTAENFFTSIGLYPMTPKFWARSMFEKPADRNVVCQAAATDLKYHDDFRVRICTQIDDNHFYTIHHEMGHVEYYMAYDKKQPFVYQGGANSAFHEAIGDTIGMYAISPLHLVKLGFIQEEKINRHYEINFLMRMALQKVAFLPFAYALDKYRFLLFRNEIDREHELNSLWWALRVEYGGIMAAVPRSDEVNFDPGAKFHVPSNTPYFKYYMAHILQFQFYRAMCRLQGQSKRLHMCDIYGNKEVGERFKDMLAMGSSKIWQETLESLTGEDHLEPQAMLDYFEPLHNWLKKENSRKGYPVGWM